MKSLGLSAIFSRLIRLSSMIIVIGGATCLAWIVFFLAARFVSSLLFLQGCIASLLCFVGISGCLLLGVTRNRIQPDFAGVIIALVGLWLGCVMTLFVVLPVSFDRSVSVFLLARIAASGKEGVSTTELERQLIQRYVVENRAVERRIREQLTIGNIKADSNSRFMLTPRGQRFLCINPALERIFRYRNPELENSCLHDGY